MTNGIDALGPGKGPRDGLSLLRNASKSHHVPAAHFLAFLIASAAALGTTNALLPSLDGEFTRITASDLSGFADPLGLTMAPFEGMGTLFQYNPLLTPSLLPIALFGERIGVWLGFVVCAALLFSSTYLLGRSIGMSRGVSLLAAWALPPLCLPYQTWIDLYMTFILNPLAGDTISFALLGLVFFIRGYATRHLYWTSAGLTGVVVWLVLTNPQWIVLLLPIGIAVVGGVVAIHARQPDFFRRSAVLVLPSLVFIAVGGGPYVWALFNNNAVAFFPHEIGTFDLRPLRFITIATAWNAIDPIGAPWIILFLLGLALATWRGRNVLRAIALSLLVPLIFFVGYGVAFVLSPSWPLPFPIYFEFLFWPFYALFAAYAIGVLAKYLIEAVYHSRFGFVARSPLAGLSPLQYTGVCTLGGVALAIFLFYHPFTAPPSPHYRRTADTTITKALHAASAVAPNAVFRGYTATLTGFKGPSGPPTDWIALMAEAFQAFNGFGNMHRIVYLWRFGVPTFEAYSQFLEPALYAVTSRMLDRPGDRQIRNVTIVTKTNIPLMESLGIRFLISDHPLSEPARLVAQVATSEISHFLFELPDPNYGGFSPTEVVIAGNATEVLQRIADSSFNFRRTVVLNEPLDQVLRPAQSSSATTVKAGWRIRAQSTGVSLLLLPLQFSNCLAMSKHEESTGKVLALRRANLVGTAVVFEGSIDVTLSLRVSPFLNPYCRIRDAREMRAFGLADIPRAISQ